MEKTTIFVKTDKGREALKALSRDISTNERRILIMVDGRHSVGQLIGEATFCDEVEAAIERLMQGGYVAIAAAGGATPAAASAPAAPARALTPEVRALFEQELVDILGPIAAILCEEALAKARSVDEALRLLAADMDGKQAAEFRRKIIERLPRS